MSWKGNHVRKLLKSFKMRVQGLILTVLQNFLHKFCFCNVLFVRICALVSAFFVFVSALHNWAQVVETEIGLGDGIRKGEV
jgi:hypothetical protein